MLPDPVDALTLDQAHRIQCRSSGPEDIPILKVEALGHDIGGDQVRTSESFPKVT